MTRSKPFRQLAAAAIGLAAFGYASHAAAVGERIALIIGNSHYVAAPVLVQPANDAEDLAKAFGAIGFDVIAATDLGGRAMRRAFRDFDQRADGASVAVIYFGGHAVAVDGVDYLMPVDARLERDTYVDDEAVPLSQVVAAVDGGHEYPSGDARYHRRRPADPRDETPAPQAPWSHPGWWISIRRAPPSSLMPFARRGRRASGRNARMPRRCSPTSDPGLGLAALLIRFAAMSPSRPPAARLRRRRVADAAVPIVLDAQTIRHSRDGRRFRASEIVEAFDRAQKPSTVEAWDAFLQFCPAKGTGDTFCDTATASRRKLVAAGRGSGEGPVAVGDGSAVGAPIQLQTHAVSRSSTQRIPARPATGWPRIPSTPTSPRRDRAPPWRCLAPRPTRRVSAPALRRWSGARTSAATSSSSAGPTTPPGASTRRWRATGRRPRRAAPLP